MLQGLYVLTDSARFDHRHWPERVEQSVLGGASIIQLREKVLPDSELFECAANIREICSYYDVLLIVNDRIQLAKQIQADGIHLGKDDEKVSYARHYLGKRFLIGVSCYRNIYTSLRAQQQGVDYVAFGSMYPSSTKQNAPSCPLAILRKAKNLLQIPVCAIGGITLHNIRPIIAAGTDIVAVGNAVFNADSPQLAANKIWQQVIM